MLIQDATDVSTLLEAIPYSSPLHRAAISYFFLEDHFRPTFKEFNRINGTKLPSSVITEIMTKAFEEGRSHLEVMGIKKCADVF